jgi:hypothetical protein
MSPREEAPNQPALHSFDGVRKLLDSLEHSTGAAEPRPEDGRLVNDRLKMGICRRVQEAKSRGDPRSGRSGS